MPKFQVLVGNNPFSALSDPGPLMLGVKVQEWPMITKACVAIAAAFSTSAATAAAGACLKGLRTFAVYTLFQLPCH